MKKKQNDSFASLNQINTKFDTLWQQLPPETQALAVEFRAFSRGRQIKNVRHLLQVVMLYCGLDYSLKTTSGVLANLGTLISDQGVAERLKGCVPWLRAVLQLMLPATPTALTEEIGAQIKRLLLIDGSSVQGPGAKTLDYRIHLAWDWLTQTICDLQVTDQKTGECFSLYQWQAGDVGVADRGYGHQKGISEVLEAGAQVIVRIAPSNLPLIDEEGQPVDLALELSRASGRLTKKVSMKADRQQRVMYLHGFELPPEKAEEARRKKKRKSQKSGHQIKKETLIYAGWTLILTSFAPQLVEAAVIGEIYRLRWQIEIVFKRLKSVMDLDKLRAGRGSRLAEAYILGKCLYILIVEKLAGRIKGAKEIAWRVWQIIREQVRPVINQSMNWKWTELTIENLQERPRRRKRQYEKLAALSIL